MKYKFFIIVFTACLFFLACSKNNETATAEQNSPAQIPISEKKTALIKDENNWYHDWDAGLEAARKENKPVLVDFFADWCKWCYVMDEKTFSDPEIKKKFASDWITVRLDTQDTETTGTFKGKTLVYRQIAGEFGVTGLPSYLFIDRNGEPVLVDGNIAIIPGYIPKEYFSIILDYFNNELYKKGVNFQEYIKSNS